MTNMGEQQIPQFNGVVNLWWYNFLKLCFPHIRMWDQPPLHVVAQRLMMDEIFGSLTLIHSVMIYVFIVLCMTSAAFLSECTNIVLLI